MRLIDTNLIFRYESEIMTRVAKLSRLEDEYENDAGDNSSEFSFEELVECYERPSIGRIDSISTISGFSHLSGPNHDTNFSSNSIPENIINSPKSEKPREHRRLSISSVNSVELLPTVPYTPSIGPSHRHTRKQSNASITPLSLTSPAKHTPPKSRSRSNSNTNSQTTPPKASPPKIAKSHSRKSSNSSERKGRSRTATGPPPPVGLRDETSALIQSTSQRLGQGMVLVRRSLQRLQKLEEKVDGALHKKLNSPVLSPIVLSPHTHHLPFEPSDLSNDGLSDKDSSLSGWLNKVCSSLL